MAEQGSLLLALLYKIFRSNTLCEYMNFCSIHLIDAASIETVKVVLEDYLDLNIKDKKYRYLKERRACLNEHYVVALMSPLVFPLLEALKDQMHP